MSFFSNEGMGSGECIDGLFFVGFTGFKIREMDGGGKLTSSC